MKNEFLCPYCRSYLMVSDRIIFSVRTEQGKRGIVLLSPELGNYSMTHHESLDFTEGEHIDFFCPVCHSNLGLKIISSDLAEVIMKDKEGVEYEIIFSEVAGKRFTYQLRNKKIVLSFGEDASEFINFWGEYPKY